MAMKKQKAASREAATTGGGQAAPTPHDTYFRYVFQQPEAARDLVLNVLRPEAGVGLPPGDRVVEVEPQSLSFVDEQLAEHRSGPGTYGHRAPQTGQASPAHYLGSSVQRTGSLEGGNTTQ